MTALVAMGVDTGRWVGWAVLDVGPRYVAAGVLDLEEIGEAAVVLELQALALAHRVTRAGVERVSKVNARRGTFDSTRATTLVQAAWLGGTVAQALRGVLPPACHGCGLLGPVKLRCSCGRAGERGPNLLTPSADAVRAHFIAGVGPVEAKRHKVNGKALDMDGAVAEVVRQRVAGWPARLPGTGAAYRKDGAALLADKRSHAHDAALVALYAAQVAP